MLNQQLVRFGVVVGLLLPTVAWPSPIGPISDIVVTETGIGPEIYQCTSFSMTENEVQEFFDQAIITTGRQQHDFFLTGPCAVRGTLNTRYGRWEWEIRNLGTGSVESITEQVFLLAVPAYESSLGDE